MAATATPYGLRAVNLIGGIPFAGSTRQISIASGYGTNIFNGSVVSIAATGTIEIVTTNGDNSTPFPAGTIGVFVGCRYTDPSTSQLTSGGLRVLLRLMRWLILWMTLMLCFKYKLMALLRKPI